MLKLRAIVLEQDERLLLRELGSLGAVQLTAAAAEEMLNLTARTNTEELARCDRILARMGELTRLFANAQPGRVAAASSLSFDEAEALLESWENQARELVRRREELHRKLQGFTDLMARLGDFRTLDAPMLQHSEFLHFITGSLPPGSLRKIKPQGNVFFLLLPALNGRQPVVAATNVSGQAELEELLQRAEFRRHDLPELSNVSKAYLNAQIGHTNTSAELNRLEAQFKSLADRAADPLMTIRDRVQAERLLLQAQRLFAHSESSVLLTGWIPAATAPTVRERLIESTGGRCIIEMLEPAGCLPGEVPVLLQHSRLLHPFEWLVKAYGLPVYNEIAPTIFVAISFVLMFGMMFGDVGHGGLLVLTGMVLLLTPHARKIRDAGILLISSGLSSIGFGIAYGSYFGLPWMKHYALWRDPLEGDPINLMRLALAIGVVLMSTGISLNVLNRFRQHAFLDGMLDKFGIAGVVFYWGTLVLLVKWAAIQTRGWGYGIILAAAVSIVCWILKDPILHVVRRRSKETPSSEGMFSTVVESVVGAFEGVLLYVANTISFVRLAAYAMAHAALLTAAFTLAAQVERSSATGTVLSLSIIILGNIMAILLEGIVATVQGLRLEYYEFFGKFFSGEGQAFKPFALLPGSTFTSSLKQKGAP